MADEQVTQLAELIRDADAVLIGAGAGMSIDAGVDYTDPVIFKELYPALAKKGLRIRYQMIGFPFESYEAKWGYYARGVKYDRTLPRYPVYSRLFDIVKDKDYFVITSNVDGRFETHGFDTQRLYTCQGDWTYMQCLAAGEPGNPMPCRPEAWWRGLEQIDAIAATIDPTTGSADPSVVPHCPHCGGKANMSVRGGDWFLEGPYMEMAGRYQDFVKRNIGNGRKLVIVEIGAGYNTPIVIRGRLERLAARHPEPQHVAMARVNPEYPQIPQQVPHGLEFPMVTHEFVDALADEYTRLTTPAA